MSDELEQVTEVGFDDAPVMDEDEGTPLAEPTSDVQDPDALNPMVPETAFGVVARSTADATAYLKHQHDINSHAWKGLCLVLQRKARNLPAVYSSAYAASQGTSMSERVPKLKDVKVGMVGYSKGSSKYGHIFEFCGKTSDGEWLVWTNDALNEPGGVNKVRVSWFAQHWGHHYLFAARSLNGFDLPGVQPVKPHPKPPAAPTIPTLRYALTRLDKALAYRKTVKTARGEALYKELKKERDQLAATIKKFG